MTDNEIFVGQKSHKKYVGACLHNLSSEGSDNDECYLVSRGRQNNSLALDVAEIVKRENDNYHIEEFNLSTEEFESEDDGEAADNERCTALRIKISKK